MNREMMNRTASAPPEAPISNADTLFTVAEAARFLKKSPRWLWSAIRRRPDEPGSVPFFRIGSSPRFFPADLAAWIRAGCPPAATFAEWQDAEKKRQNRAR